MMDQVTAQGRGAVSCSAPATGDGDEDNAALESLIRRLGGPLLSLARRYLRCEAAALAALGEGMATALRARSLLEPTALLEIRMRDEVIAACAARLRASGALRQVEGLERLLPAFHADGHHAAPVRPWPLTAVGDGAPVGGVPAARASSSAREAIDRLPEGYRVVLLLSDVDGWSPERAAELLGLSPAAVRARLHRARQAMRAMLEPAFASAAGAAGA